jgi:hypothetical protein
LWLVPQSCYVRAIDVAEARTTRVQRCEFAWARGGAHGRGRPGFGAPLRRPGARRAPAP